MQRGLLLAALPLAGCAQLFGIDNTTGPGTGSGASLSIQRVSVGASVSKAPQDVSMDMASFLVGDASGLTLEPAMSSTPGVWTANVPGSPPALFTLPDLPMGAQHLYALGSRATKGNLFAFEHPNPMMPGATSALSLAVTIPAYNGERLEVFAVGAWMNHNLAGAEVPALMATSIAATIPYSMFNPAAGNTPARITMADVVLVLRYTGAVLSGVLQATPFDQTDGTDNIGGTMTAVAADKTLSIPLPTDLATRYSAVRPAVGAPGQSWSINAAPGESVGIANGVTLINGAPAATDTMITAMYGNPFESLGWPGVFTYSTSASRTYMFNGVAVGLAASLSSVVDATATSAPLDAGLPTTILLGSTMLSTDGQMVTVDQTVPVAFSFLSDKSMNTTYGANVYELVVNGTAVEKNLLIAAVSTEPNFLFPAGTLQTGHTYSITAVCGQGGVPNAATGDLQSSSFPVSHGAVDSAVFTVQ
jgi:hypothetical protein